MKTLSFILMLGLSSCAIAPKTSLVAPTAAFAVSVLLDEAPDRAAKIVEIKKVIEVIDSFPVDHLVTKEELKAGLVYALPDKPHWELFAETIAAGYGDAVAGYINDAEGVRKSAAVLKEIAASLKIVAK